MSKYNVIFQLWGLNEFIKANRSSFYTPSGNYWRVINNGILGGQLLYDEKTKKIYGFCIKEITDARQEFIDNIEEEIILENARKVMTVEQAKSILVKKERE